MEGNVCSSMSSDAAVTVKEEVLWEQVVDSRGVSESAALAGLYTDHEVKEELVIGPEVLQPPDTVFTADQTCANSERSRGCHGDHTYAKTESPKTEVLVKEEVVECLRGEAAREASAVREQPADFVGLLERSDSLEARRGTRPVPNSAHVGNQLNTKADIDTEKETFVCDICEQRFALKARLMEHVTIHVHRSAERGEGERGVADHDSRGVSEAAALAGLYTDHEVKEELVIGPEVLQPPDAVFTADLLVKEEVVECLRGEAAREASAVREQPADFVGPLERSDSLDNALQKKEQTDCRTQAAPRRTCSVVLEPMLVDMELCVCKIGHQIYEFRSGLENDASHSDEEFNSSNKFGSPARLRNKELKKGQTKTNKSKVLLQKKNENRKRQIIPKSDKSPFKCNQCSFTSSSRSNIKVHLRTHTGEKPFKCNHCSSMFAYKRSLIVHLRTHTGEKPFKCNHCSSMFVKKSYLLDHLRTHKGEKPFKCNHCSSTFTQRGHLLCHLRTHTGEKPFKCDHCSSMFTERSHLTRHLRIHTGEKPFQCNHCSSMFAHKSSLIVHLRTHTGEKPFKCNHCSSMFTHKSSLLNHLRTHTGEKPFKCNHCSFMFAHKSSLLNHLRTHTGEKPFKCNHCSSMFKQRSHLQSHLRTHTGEKPFKCNHCSFMFAHKSSLLNHLRTHTGEKPFKCNHCSSMFTQKYSLRLHLRTHTGEKPFQCNHCSSMFAQKSNLLVHLRTHTGEKPLKCSNCSSIFARKSSLQAHLRTHTGEEPFKCNHCSSTFRHKSSLVRHRKSL